MRPQARDNKHGGAWDRATVVRHQAGDTAVGPSGPSHGGKDVAGGHGGMWQGDVGARWGDAGMAWGVMGTWRDAAGLSRGPRRA